LFSARLRKAAYAASLLPMRRLLPLLLPVFAAAAPPNLVLVVSDDQRPDTIAALHGSHLRTPNLDRLAARGTVFTRAYAGYPICHVSRAELLTGCTAFRAYPNYPAGPIDPALPQLAATLGAAGYRTWYSGKWHNDGQPTQRGYGGIRALYSSGGGRGAAEPGLDARGHPRTGYRGWTFKDDAGQPDPAGGVGLQPDNSRRIIDGALRALGESPPDRPFFLHVNFAFPHDPRQWPPDPAHHHDPATTPLPRNFAPDHSFDHGNRGGRDEVLLPLPRTEAAVRAELAVYHSMITDLDAQLGRLLDALAADGRATIVVFTSDQGLALGSHGLLGKQNCYEHSIRSPLVIAGPGLPQGRRSEALVLLRDLHPTLCELAGVPVPASVQARSLLPVLQGRTDRVHDRVFAAYTDTQRMVCETRYKLILYPQPNRRQLFDLTADPDELRNLADDPAHAAERERLETLLTDWRHTQGDPLHP
jgi:arylsulfatase A-like enzyme